MLSESTNVGFGIGDARGCRQDCQMVWVVALYGLPNDKWKTLYGLPSTKWPTKWQNVICCDFHDTKPIKKNKDVPL